MQKTTLSPPEGKTCGWYNKKQSFRLNQCRCIGTGDVPHCTQSHKFFNTWNVTLCPLPCLLYPPLPPASPIYFLFFSKRKIGATLQHYVQHQKEVEGFLLQFFFFLYAEVAGAAADRVGCFTYSLSPPCPVLPQPN